MPRFATLPGGISIYLYPQDHNPPHFHVRGGEHDAAISIETGGVMAGTIDRRTFAAVWAWLAEDGRVDQLHAEWDRLNERG